MNLRKVWTIARHEYITNIRRTGFIIMTLIVPAIGFLALFLSMFSGKAMVEVLVKTVGGLEKPYAVVDECGPFHPILPEFQKDFILYPDRAAARKAVDEKKAQAALIIPADFIEKGVVYVYSSEGTLALASLSDSRRVQAFFTVHLVHAYVPPDVEKRLAKGQPHFEVINKPATTSPVGKVVSFMIPYALAMLLIISIFISSGYLLQGVGEEKENRLVEIILSSVTPQEWFLGKVIGLGAVGLTQISVWLLTMVLLSGGSVMAFALVVPALPVQKIFFILLYYALGYTLYATLYAGLGALGTNIRESQQVAGVISFLAAIPFMVSGLLFTNPNAPLIRVISIFPLTAPTMMMMRVSMSEIPREDVVASIILLFLTIPFSIWLGGKLFRFGMLIYGKRPSLKAVWQALRAA